MSRSTSTSIAAVEGYLRDAASHRSDAATLSAFLDAVIASNGLAAVDRLEQRRLATRELLTLLGGTGTGNGSALFTDEARLKAVTALKTLGRTAAGTEDLASDEGVRCLVSLAGLDSPDRASTATDPGGLQPIAAEATRCLANVCLLHEPARLRFSSVPGIAKGILHGLGPAVPAATRFLSARLLFLCTVSGGDTVRHLVEDLDVAGVLAARLHEYAVPSAGPASVAIDASASASAKAEADILEEYLKIIFNLSLFYPRLARDKEKDKEDSAAAAAAVASSPSKRDNKMLSPESSRPEEGSSSSSSAVSASRSRSPSPSPSNGRAPSPSHSPQPQVQTPAGAGVQHRTRQKSSRSDKIKGLFSRSSTNINASKPVERERETTREATGTGTGSGSGSGKSAVWEDEADVLKPWGFEGIVGELVRLALCLPLGSESSGGPFGTYKHVITSLLNFDLSAYASLAFAPLSPPNAPPIPELPATTTSPSASASAPRVPPFPARLLALLDDTCGTYIPHGPDDADSREAAAALAAPESLDECLGFLILLLAKCATEDTEGTARRAMRQCLLADDIDRSVGLEKRKDLTGRLVRLMSSTYLSSSGDAAGKLLFALCDQDPSTFAGVLGYGNASGFLQNIGMLVPPSSVPVQSHSEAGTDVNPITGAVNAPVDESEASRAAMTDDEKEREAERLFVLFDRLNRNGAISVENPVRAAQQSGKFAQQVRDEETRFQEIEDEEEKEALEEMRRYKERKARR